MVQQNTEKSGHTVRNTIYHATFTNTAYKVEFAIILVLILIIMTNKSSKRAVYEIGVVQYAYVYYTSLSVGL